MKYSYKIITKDNKIVGGSVSALSKGGAVKALAQEGAAVLFVARQGSPVINLPSFGFSKLERILFFRNLSTMLAAGLPLGNALGVTQEQVQGRNVKKAIGEITQEVQNGQKLSSAMARFPKYFPEYLTETVGMGEITGQLSETMERISADLESDYDLARRVRTAMAYPIIVVTVMVLVIIGMMAYVLPQIAELFQEMEASLPLPTKILLSISTFIRTQPFIVAGALAAITASLYLIWRNKKGRYGLHYLSLKLPLFGELAKEFNLARFFRALDSLYSSGVSLDHSVEIGKKTLKNRVYRRALNEIQPVLLHGIPLSETLKPFPILFPIQTQRLIEVGERAGKLNEIFMRITTYYEHTVKHKTQILASLIEPILIILIGLVLGGLAVSIFLPIYRVSTVL